MKKMKIATSNKSSGKGEFTFLIQAGSRKQRKQRCIDTTMFDYYIAVLTLPDGRNKKVYKIPNSVLVTFTTF